MDYTKIHYWKKAFCLFQSNEGILFLDDTQMSSGGKTRVYSRVWNFIHLATSSCMDSHENLKQQDKYSIHKSFFFTILIHDTHTKKSWFLQV